MTSTIYKYTLKSTGEVQTVNMPAGSAGVLGVGVQAQDFVIWVLITDKDKEGTVDRRFRILLTGDDFDLGAYGPGFLRHVGSAQFVAGYRYIVGHVFEVSP